MSSPPLTGDMELDSYLYSLQLGIDAAGSSAATAMSFNEVVSNYYPEKYIQIRYADSNTGKDISTSPTDKKYYGVYNSITTTASNNPADYTWYEVDGSFDSTYYLFYTVTFGRNINLFIGTTAPTVNWEVCPTTYIDLDTITTGYVNNESFENQFEPIKVLTSLPDPSTYSGPKIVYISTTNKLYRYSAGQWTSNVLASDIDGTLAINNFSNDLRPVEVVSALPTSGNFVGRTAVLTTNGKLYRYTTTGWSTAVPTGDLTGTIGASQIDANAVTTDKLDANAVTTGKLAAGAVTTDILAANSVVTGKIAAGAVTANSVTTGELITLSAQIRDATITNAKITDATITSAKIVDATITGAKIQDAAITTAKIGDAQINTAKIADAQITTAKINDLSVSTLKIQNNAVTIPVAATGGGINNISSNIGTPTQILSVSIVSSGAPKVIQVAADTSSSYYQDAETNEKFYSTYYSFLERTAPNGVVTNIALNIVLDGSVVILALDTNSQVGTYTYKVKAACYPSLGPSYYGTTTITVLEVKK